MAKDPGGVSRQNYWVSLDPDPASPIRKKPNLGNYKDFPNMRHQVINTNKKECPKFLVIKNKDSAKPLNEFNIFLVTKAISGLISDPLSVKFTADGNILMLTKNTQQANLLLKKQRLSNLCEIEVSMHPSLNTSLGVIFSPELKNLSEEEIKEGLSDQQVTECKKITKFIDGKVTNTPLHILSFNLYELPTEIKIGFLKTKVEPYIPKPMQCKKCFRYGHTKKHCRSEQQICDICSINSHDPEPCQQVLCVNCKHEHSATNKNCPANIKRTKILEIKTEKKITYQEANKHIIENPHLYPEPSTANIPKESLSEIIEQRKNRRALQIKNQSTKSQSDSNMDTTEINTSPSLHSTPTPFNNNKNTTSAHNEKETLINKYINKNITNTTNQTSIHNPNQQINTLLNTLKTQENTKKT